MIIFFLLLQIFDMSPGIQNNSFKHNVKKNYDPIWQLIDNEYQEELLIFSIIMDQFFTNLVKF